MALTKMPWKLRCRRGRKRSRSRLWGDAARGVESESEMIQGCYLLVDQFIFDLNKPGEGGTIGLVSVNPSSANYPSVLSIRARLQLTLSVIP